MSTLVLGGLFAVVLGWIVWAIFTKEEDPLDRLPSPPQLPIIGSSHLFIGKSPAEIFQLTRGFAKEYGDRFVIKVFNRRVLAVNSPRDVEAVLSHSKNITKNQTYRFLEPWLGTGLLLSTGAKWHRRRKILTPTFHFNILKNFAKVIEEKSRNMVNELKKHQQIEIDLMPTISDFTLYTICETAMGVQLDNEKTVASKQYKKAVLDLGPLILERTIKAWLHFNFLFKHTALAKQFYSCLEKVHSFADKIILERRDEKMTSSVVASALEGEVVGGKKRLAMLDLLLEAEQKGEIDLEGIREEVNTFMFEGHDTTATALTFGLMLLADHEEIQERIFEEQQSVFSSGDPSRTPSMADLAEMKYLEAVIKEALRLYPSVPFIARRTTEDFQMGDLFVKRGTEIAVHIYDLHRRADLYPDPEAFRPERFLNGEVKDPYAFVPFSAGPRNCIGQRFAMQEMKCALSEIFRNFRLTPKIRGFRPALVTDVVLRTNDSIYVNFIRR